MNPDIILTIGFWIRAKYRLRAQQGGHYAAAKQLRKQGIPLEVALLILFGK